SLPSRGAWIEILEIQNNIRCKGRSPRGERGEKSRTTAPSGRLVPVAPLAGSVDRNNTKMLRDLYMKLSLPSRGAWIEMFMALANSHWLLVAPLAGSVDRNKREAGRKKIDAGRSPRGERG